VLASYGHSGTALLWLFSFYFDFFGDGVVVRVGTKEIKSWNLNPGFCKLHREFNSGVRGLV
jgi:hypothetical protein